MVSYTTHKNTPLRIAQVAPLHESVPPQLYGGTERIVSYITEELVRQGHDVTLFASADSKTLAKLEPCCERALRLDDNCVDTLAPHMLMIDRVCRKAEDFDIVHFHCDYLHFPLSRNLNVPHVTTLHGRLDVREYPDLYREFSSVPLVSISNNQRTPLAWCNWQATVYHGLPIDLHTFRPESGKYLAFLGRLSSEKGADQAIEIARRVGMPLRIAAKIPEDDSDFYQNTLRPLLEDHASSVEFIGEIGGADKDEFLGNAHALLFPINWPEPFGLVMIEAMACGTPVIAYRRGSVPEVMEDGVTGFIVENVDQAVAALERVPSLSRADCRKVFEDRFTVERMVDDYLQVYGQLLADSPDQTPSRNGKLPLSRLDGHEALAAR